MVGTRAAEVFELLEKNNKLTDKVKAKELELQTLPAFAEEATKFRNNRNELWAAVGKDEANVAVMSGI